MNTLIIRLTENILLFSASLALLIAFIKIIERTPHERLVRNIAFPGTVILTFASLLLGILYLLDPKPVHVDMTPWFVFRGYEFQSTLLINELSLTYGILTSFTMLVIVRFSKEYLHKDPGYDRFFLLIMILQAALLLISYSGNFDTLFIGWELVGIASVLLISFFRDNSRATENSIRAITIYRLCDAGMLAASAWLHHYVHHNDFIKFSQMAGHPAQGIIAAFILIATLGKSAQLPMSGWLHRAMEGPTPSSAVFYGGLSIHLGPFLLLRTMPLWIHSIPLRIAMFTIGASTALYATLTGNVRSDIKTVLAYRSMAQVGIIFVELSLGLSTVALIHVVLHSIYRTKEFLVSASLLEKPIKRAIIWPIVARTISIPFQKSLFIAASNCFYLDEFLKYYFVRPYLKLTAYFTSTPLNTLRTIFFVQISLSFLGSFISTNGRLGAVCVLGMSSILYPCLKYLLARPQSPLSHRFFLIFGLSFIGLPGTIAYVGEDLLFHTLIEVSGIATMVFIFATCLNGIEFYRIYHQVFLLESAHESRKSNKELSPRQVFALMIVLLFAGLTGVFPSFIFNHI